MLKQSNRLHGAETVSQILKKGAFKKTSLFALRKLANEFGQNRYGIVLSTKLEKSAVKRNHKRRQVYSIISELEEKGAVPSSPSYDNVILFRGAGLKLNFTELKEAIQKLLNG